MTAAALTREQRGFLPAMLSAQLRGLAKHEPATIARDVPLVRRAGQPVTPLRFLSAPGVACCGECRLRPDDPQARTCNVANCGLIGRHHHVQGDRT